MKYKKNKILLKEIEIFGFQTKNKKVKVRFADGNSSVIFGDNGSGKTTFLKVLNAILKQDNVSLYKECIKKIIITYSVNNIEKYITIRHIPKEDKVDLEKKEQYQNAYTQVVEPIERDEKSNDKYDWTEFNKSELSETKSISMGVDRGVTQRNQTVDSADIYTFISRNRSYREDFLNMNRHKFSRELASYITRTFRRNSSRGKVDSSLKEDHTFLQDIRMNNIEALLLERYEEARSFATERIQYALFDTLSFIFQTGKIKDINIKDKPSISYYFKTSLLKNKERIIEALKDDSEHNKFKTKVIEILSSIEKDNDVEEKIDNQILYNLIENMMRELELEKLLLSSISTFTEEYNKFLGDEKRLVITSDEIYIEIDDDEYDINILSSGERHIFTFLSLVIVEGVSRDFIFIDEPEISLNVKWQRKLMKLLEKLAPNAQIIVASHSPLIAKKMTSSLVELSPEKI